MLFPGLSVNLLNENIKNAMILVRLCYGLDLVEDVPKESCIGSLVFQEGGGMSGWGL